MPNNKYYDSPRISELFARRKSKPSNVVQPKIPGTVKAPNPPLTPHMHPRRKSSWYSQSTIPEAPPVPPMPDYSLHGYTNPYAPPLPAESPPPAPKAAPIPLSYDALRSSSGRSGRSTSSWEDDEPESPGGTRPSSQNQFMTQRQHDAVSEYLHNRSWTSHTLTHSLPAPRHAIPAPTSTPPSVPTAGRVSGVLRRFSFSSGSESSSRRRSSAKSRHSISSSPHRAMPGEYEEHYGGPTPVTPRTPSLTISSPLSMLRSRLDRTPTTPATEVSSPISPTATITIGADSQIFSKPYETTRQATPPVKVTTLHAFDHQQPRQGTANAALIRGLSQKYGPKTQLSSQPAVTTPHKITYQYPDSSTPNRSLTTTTQPPPPYVSRAPAPSKPLQTRTRNPYVCTNQCAWLNIGTLRAITPSGVRQIDGIMERNLVDPKKGQEAAVKEIMKILKYERRAVIEWVEGYLRARWETEL